MKCKKQMILAIVILFGLLFFGTKSHADTAIVNTDTLKLRKEASTDATVLELLNEGEKLEVLEQSGDWVKVKVKQMTGYVHKDYVKIQKTEKNDTQKKENTVNEEQNTLVEENENNTTIEQNNVEEEQNTEGQKQEGSIIREVIIKENTSVFILPLINANKIGNLNKNTKVIVMDEVTNWLYIQTDTISGWVLASTLEEKNNVENNNTNNSNTNNTTTNANTSTPENQNTQTENNTQLGIQETPIDRKVMYVNYSSIYVRKGPSTQEESIDSLTLNAQVTVIAEVEDWYKVEVAGQTGYIAKRLLSSSKTETTTRNAEERKEEQNDTQETATTEVTTSLSKGEEIVNYAKQYLGCPYVYGGSGPKSFDCSGFTMYVYQHFGISLSHSARAQANNGTYVEKSDLKPGDLVFFKDYETMDGIGHCGIYIGEGNFIHASSGTGYCVKISTLLTGSYNNRYETARRIF